MKNKIPLIVILGAIVVSSVLIFYPGRNGASDASLDGFAQCLADTGAVMYGAYWCSHCKTEKEGFGASWRLVPYVECTEETKLCLEKGIKGYPTWILGDGERLEGVQGPERLSKATGCALPEGE